MANESFGVVIRIEPSTSISTVLYLRFLCLFAHLFLQ